MLQLKITLARMIDSLDGAFYLKAFGNFGKSKAVIKFILYIYLLLGNIVFKLF